LRGEVELLPEHRGSEWLVLILPEHGAVGIDYHRGVVATPGALSNPAPATIDLSGKCGALHDRPSAFSEIVMHVLGDARWRVEQLLEQITLCAPEPWPPGTLVVDIDFLSPVRLSG
jgi:hypothetical protein